MHNPYLDLVGEYVLQPDERDGYALDGMSEKIVHAQENGLNLYRYRDEMVEKFSWAIPNGRAIRAIVELGPIVEIGAGAGYWGWLIEQQGGDYVGYDLEPLRDPTGPIEWTHVEQGGTQAAGEHADRALMLCWPPYASPMAMNALDAYEGDTLVYIGEGRGGCTGDDDFHHDGLGGWDSIERIDIPQWPGIHDGVEIFKR